MEAKEIKGLMEAYASVYENQEQIDEYAQGGGGAAPNVPPAVHKFVDELPQRAGELIQRITGAAKPKPKEKPVKEENLFDIIKDHLMSEGYADTEEAALKIMANMSEDWKQTILNLPGKFAGGIEKGLQRLGSEIGNANVNLSGMAKPKPQPKTKSEPNIGSAARKLAK